MNRTNLEAFATRWLDAICEGTTLEPLLGGDLDPAVFDERAAGARTRVGSPIEGTIDEIVGEDDRVAWRWTLRGSNATIRGVNFQRIVDGRAIAHWTMAM